MRTIDLESLKIFRTVVDEGGVVRAATKLNRVQSNVTTRIRQLEEHVGARLFRREGRSIRLSAEGHTLLAYANRLLRLADEAVSEMRTGRPKGAFRLGSLESTAGSRLPAILSRYHTLYPDVVVELATGTAAALVTRVMNFEIEAAFVSEPFTAPGLETRPVFEEQLVLVTSKATRKVSGPADHRPLDAHRLRPGLLLSQAHRGVARQRQRHARTGAGVRLLPGHDRLRRGRHRVCRGAQVRARGPAREQRACASTRSPSGSRTIAPIWCGTASLHRLCRACCRSWTASRTDRAPGLSPSEK